MREQDPKRKWEGWPKQWTAFENHWEDILDIPIDPLAVAGQESEADDVVVNELLRDMDGIDRTEALEVRREIIDTLVAANGKSLRYVTGELKALTKKYDEEHGAILLHVLDDLLTPWIKNRLNLQIIEDLMHDSAYQQWAHELSGEPAKDLLGGDLGQAIILKLLGED